MVIPLQIWMEKKLNDVDGLAAFSEPEQKQQLTFAAFVYLFSFDSAAYDWIEYFSLGTQNCLLEIIVKSL